MGNLHAQHRRMTPALIVTVVAVLAIVAVLAVTAGPASALGAYEHASATSCGSCHTSSPPSSGNVTNTQCQVCHTGFTTAHAVGGVASTCWTCHTPGQNLTTVKTNAAVGGCGATAAGASCHGKAGHVGSTPTTCVNCHSVTVSATNPGQSAHHKTSVTDVSVKTLLTGKFTTTRIAFGKTAKATGLAKSVQAGYVVKVQVYRKTATGAYAKVGILKKAIWTQSTSKWTFSFKPAKRGVYRLQVSVPVVPGTNGNAIAIPAKKITTKTITVK